MAAAVPLLLRCTLRVRSRTARDPRPGSNALFVETVLRLCFVQKNAMLATAAAARTAAVGVDDQLLITCLIILIMNSPSSLLSIVRVALFMIGCPCWAVDDGRDDGQRNLRTLILRCCTMFEPYIASAVHKISRCIYSYSRALVPYISLMIVCSQIYIIGLMHA